MVASTAQTMPKNFGNGMLELCGFHRILFLPFTPPRDHSQALIFDRGDDGHRAERIVCSSPGVLVGVILIAFPFHLIWYWVKLDIHDSHTACQTLPQCGGLQQCITANHVLGWIAKARDALGQVQG